jgi:hypothetical protein
MAQAPENKVPTPAGAALSSSVPASTEPGGTNTFGTTSLGSASPGEIVTPSTPSPPGGVVTLASIEDRFAQLDKNRNGFLTPEELDLIPRDRISSSAVRFRQMDTNHDGKVSKEEYLAFQSALIASDTAPLPPILIDAPTTTNSTDTAPGAPSASQQ